MRTSLDLPDRASKPRRHGLTMVIDGGLPLGQLRDVLHSHAAYVDLVKFGWGTAVVSPDLEAKTALLAELDVAWFVGGTLLEKHVAQGKLEDYVTFCHDLGCAYAEVSDGTLPMRPGEKAACIERLAGEFTVLAEVGFKQPARNAGLSPRDWARAARADLDAGASLVITESRESGTTGFASPDGECRDDVLDAILDSGIRPDQLLFEAPTKAMQAHLVQRLGPDVNLGNIAPSDVLGLETLRLGLRADTFAVFETEAMLPRILEVG